MKVHGPTTESTWSKRNAIFATISRSYRSYRIFWWSTMKYKELDYETFCLCRRFRNSSENSEMQSILNFKNSIIKHFPAKMTSKCFINEFLKIQNVLYLKFGIFAEAISFTSKIFSSSSNPFNSESGLKWESLLWTLVFWRKTCQGQKVIFS